MISSIYSRCSTLTVNNNRIATINISSIKYNSTIVASYSGYFTHGSNMIINDIDTTYKYDVYAFGASGQTYVIDYSLTGGSTIAYILAVGGGGSGGCNGGGGGGGGGVVMGNVVLPKGPGNITISIGRGGYTSLNGIGEPGTSTTVNFSTASSYNIIAGGGGGGSIYNNTSVNTNTNSSGGGAGIASSPSNKNITPNANYSIYANDGGEDDAAGIQGGGGGAGTAGSNGSSTSIPNGGNGIKCNLLGISTFSHYGTSFGRYYWGGGGGGSSIGATSAGNGGLGGGGGGVQRDTALAGTGGGSALNSGGNGLNNNGIPGNGGANTGGGGGGSYNNPTATSRGGSGIVVIAFSTVAAVVNTIVLNSVNVENLKNISYMAIDPSGINLIVVNTSGSIYKVSFIDRTYNTTQYYTSNPNITSITYNGYGNIKTICVTRSNFYIIGAISYINTSTVAGGILVGSIPGTMLTPYFTSVYTTTRFLSGAYWDMNNTIIISYSNFADNPSDSYFSGYQNTVQPLLVFINKTKPTTLPYANLFKNTGFLTVNTNVTTLYSDPSYNNIYMNIYISGGSFTGTVSDLNNKINSITKYNISTDTSIILTELTYSGCWSVFNSINNSVIAVSDNYVYSILETINNSIGEPLYSTDGTNTICKYIFRVNISSKKISAMGTGANDIIYNIIFDNKKKRLFASGKFTSMNDDLSIKYIAVWYESIQIWQSFVTLNDTCTNMVFSNDYSILFLSGTFTLVNSVSCNGFCAIKC